MSSKKQGLAPHYQLELTIVDQQAKHHDSCHPEAVEAYQLHHANSAQHLPCVHSNYHAKPPCCSKYTALRQILAAEAMHLQQSRPGGDYLEDVDNNQAGQGVVERVVAVACHEISCGHGNTQQQGQNVKGGYGC